MKKIMIHPTDTAQWLALLTEAQQSSSIQLHEEIESYLVFMLMRFMGQPDVANSVLGLEFLESANISGVKAQHQLRDVGDKCLLLSGLFPGRAERRQVKLSYFIQLGQSAYSTISYRSDDPESDLFSELSNRFVHMRDVLYALRVLSPDQPSMSLWQALDLWESNQSTAARQQLEDTTHGIIHPESRHKQ